MRIALLAGCSPDTVVRFHRGHDVLPVYRQKIEVAYRRLDVFVPECARRPKTTMKPEKRASAAATAQNVQGAEEAT